MDGFCLGGLSEFRLGASSFFSLSLFASPLACSYFLGFLGDPFLYFINLLVANVGFGSWSFGVWLSVFVPM